METLKDFVKNIAYGTDGAGGGPKATISTVAQYWRNFAAGWQRQNPVIPPETTRSITNVCPVHLLLLFCTEEPN